MADPRRWQRRKRGRRHGSDVSLSVVASSPAAKLSLLSLILLVAFAPPPPCARAQPFTINTSTNEVSHIPWINEDAVVANQNVPTNYGSTLMNNVQSGSLNAPRTAITGSQDNFYESCPSQAARLALPGAPCAAAMEALKEFSAGLATAECRIVGLAMRSQPGIIPPDCCPALRQFVRDGCACDTATRFVAPAAAVKIIDLVAAVRVAQVSVCATDEYGGAIPNPCRNIVSCEVNALQGQVLPTPAPSRLLSTGTTGKPPPAKAPAAPGSAAAAGAAGAAAVASAAAQPRPAGAGAVPNAVDGDGGGPSHVVPERVGILGHPMERVEKAEGAAGGAKVAAAAATTAAAAAAASPFVVPAAPATATALPATNAAAPRTDPAPVAPAAAAVAAVAPATADTAAPAAQKPPAAAAASSSAAATVAPPQQPVPPQGAGVLRQVYKQQQQRERHVRPDGPPEPPPRRRKGGDSDGTRRRRSLLLQLEEAEPAASSTPTSGDLDPATLFAEDEGEPLKPEEAAAIQASADATAAVLAGTMTPTPPQRPPQRPPQPPQKPPAPQPRLAKMTDPDPTPPATKAAAPATAATAAGSSSNNPVPVAAVVSEGGVVASSNPGKLSRVTDSAAASAAPVVPAPGKLSRLNEPTPKPTPKAVAAAAAAAGAPSAAAKKMAPAPAPSSKAAVVPTQAGWLGAVPLPTKPAPTPKPVAPVAGVVAAGGAVVAKPGSTAPVTAVARAPAAAKKEVPIDWKWGPHPAKWFASWPRVKKNGEMQKFIKTPGVGNLPDPNPYYVPNAKEQAIIDKKAAKTPAWTKYEEKEKEREEKGILKPLHLFTKDAPPPGKLNPMKALIAPTTRKYIEGFKWETEDEYQLRKETEPIKKENHKRYVHGLAPIPLPGEVVTPPSAAPKSTAARAGVVAGPSGALGAFPLAGPQAGGSKAMAPAGKAPALAPAKTPAKAPAKAPAVAPVVAGAKAPTAAAKPAAAVAASPPPPPPPPASPAAPETAGRLSRLTDPAPASPGLPSPPPPVPAGPPGKLTRLGSSDGDSAAAAAAAWTIAKVQAAGDDEGKVDSSPADSAPRGPPQRPPRRSRHHDGENRKKRRRN